MMGNCVLHFKFGRVVVVDFHTRKVQLTLSKQQNSMN